jgi:hypothetical protein
VVERQPSVKLEVPPETPLLKNASRKSLRIDIDKMEEISDKEDSNKNEGSQGGQTQSRNSPYKSRYTHQSPSIKSRSPVKKLQKTVEEISLLRMAGLKLKELEQKENEAARNNASIKFDASNIKSQRLDTRQSGELPSAVIDSNSLGVSAANQEINVAADNLADIDPNSIHKKKLLKKTFTVDISDGYGIKQRSKITLNKLRDVGSMTLDDSGASQTLKDIQRIKGPRENRIPYHTYAGLPLFITVNSEYPFSKSIFLNSSTFSTFSTLSTFYPFLF